MRLSANILKNYVNVNSFWTDSQWSIRSGDPNTLYFQLVDLDRESQRYVPTGTPVTMLITFPAVNPANVVTKIATQAAAGLDGSIWSFTVSATDKLFSGNVLFSITEAGVTRNFYIIQGIAVEQIDGEGGC